MKQILKMLGSIGFCVATSIAAQAQEIRILSSFPEGFVYNTDLLNPFIDLVVEESGGDISFNVAYSDAVPPLEQFEPVQAGVFDMLLSHPAYHAGATSLGLAIDGIKPMPSERRESGVFDFIDKHYQTLGIKVIAIPPISDAGAFRIYLRDEITGDPALEGRRIRGTIGYHPLIEALGGAGVVMGGGKVYSSLQKGVVDGAAFSIGAHQLRWFEVANYVAQPDFGYLSAMIYMNLDAWNSLSSDAQAAIGRAAVRLELSSTERFNALLADELESLIAAGMKVTQFAPATATKLNSLMAEGTWGLAESADADKANALRNIARDAGLAD